VGDYEMSTTVMAGADDVFAHLADGEDLADLLPGAAGARLAADTGARTVRWNSEDGADHGELEVTPAEDGSTVTVRLHTGRADGDGVQSELDQALAAIRRHIEMPPGGIN
jgi:hypothetical protein